MPEIEIALTVNGTPVARRMADDATLMDFLRGELRLNGARKGCGQESCGACRVLVDGKPEFSCTYLAEMATGRTVETVEGLEQNDPVVTQIVAHQAAQCAFCLPGMIMTAKALLRGNPAPDRADIVRALEPHLCRCGAHTRIVSAIEAAAVCP